MYYKFICTIFILLFSIGCSIEKKSDTQKAVEIPDMVQINYKHYIYKAGRIYLEAFVGVGRSYEKTKQINCEVIDAVVYNSKNEKVTTIKSDTGNIDSNNSTLIFIGNVKIDKIDKDAVIYADEIKLNYSDNTLSSDKPVVIKKEDGSILKASSMFSDLKEQKTDFSQMDLVYYYEDDEKDKK